jgi:hypothetical protein
MLSARSDPKYGKFVWFYGGHSHNLLIDHAPDLTRTVTAQKSNKSLKFGFRHQSVKYAFVVSDNIFCLTSCYSGGLMMRFAESSEGRQMWVKKEEKRW